MAAGRTRRPWLLVLAGLLFAVISDPGLAAFPLVLLLIASRLETIGAAVLGAGTVLAALWLQGGSSLPDQTVKAGMLVAGPVFLWLTWGTTWSVTHRALASTGAAAALVAAAYLSLGRSWQHLHWAVETEVGYRTRSYLSLLWAGGTDPSAGEAEGRAFLPDLQRWMEEGARLAADYFPALSGAQIILGLVLAAAIYYRVGSRPRGRGPGRVRDFRFSEHLGWLAVIPLLIVLFVKSAAWKLAAANVLVISAGLYAWRGAAVAAFAAAVSGGGLLAGALAGLALVFMLPLIVSATIILGVLDAGIDFRKRWLSPPV